jgi:hypothetical protein
MVVGRTVGGFSVEVVVLAVGMVGGGVVVLAVAHHGEVADEGVEHAVEAVQHRLQQHVGQVVRADQSNTRTGSS